MAEQSDSELVRLAKAGQVEAFGELVKRHMKGVYALAYSFVQNHTDADDLSQETFLRAYRALASFEERSSFRTWLYRTAFNLCANYVRRRTRAVCLVQDSGLSVDTLSHVRAKSPGPEEAASLKELEEHVARLVRALPQKLRVALHLVVYQGLSHQEAAGVIGRSANTVSWRVFRARELLRKQLAPFIEE